MVSKTEQGHLPKEVSKRAADKHAELLSVLLQLPHPNVDPAFWCGQVGVTREYVFNYPSVYDLHWSHYYSEVIHIQNQFIFFYKEISSSGLLKHLAKNHLNMKIISQLVNSSSQWVVIFASICNSLRSSC